MTNTSNVAKPARVAKVGKGHNSRAMLLDAVYDAAINVGAGDKAVAAAIKAAGGNQEDVRREFFLGYMVGRKGFTKEQAITAFSKKWNAKGDKKGDDYQTKPQYDACNGAKVAWARALATAGIKSNHSNSGNGNAKSNAMDTEKLVVPGKPKVATNIELAAWINAQAMVPVNFFLLNKAHPATQGALAKELQQATFDHAECVKAIIAKFEVPSE